MSSVKYGAYFEDVSLSYDSTAKRVFLVAVDKSRVPLSVVGNDEKSSYINASFVQVTLMSEGTRALISYFRSASNS